MKLSQEYPNFLTQLDFFINDKHPVLASNDSKKLSYFIPLPNFKKGFDYYELDRMPDGGVKFSLVTMLGFKTIVQTSTDVFYEDLSNKEWNDGIFKTTMAHFGKEEYIALKHNYVKKGQNSSGCMLTILAFIMITSIGFLLN